MEDQNGRVTRKRNERKSNGEKRKKQGVATLRIFADVGRVISFLFSQYDRWNF